MNYPRIWQLLFRLGIDQSDTIYFGLVFAALFFSGVFLITKNIDRPTAWLMMCAVFSPAVLLGLERGNCDLLMFFLLALAVYFIKISRVATAIVIGLAFLLKLYPIFALAIFLRENKRVFRVVIVSSIIICGIYALVMFDELRLIRLMTPRPPAGAYGIDVAWTDLLIHHFPRAAMALRIILYVSIALVIIFSLFYAGRRVDGLGDCDGHMDSFRVGAAAYIGTYLIGGNWDYRLMVLLLVIPQLMDWRRSSWKAVKYIATTTLVCVMIALWAWFTKGLLAHLLIVSFLLDSLSKWIVFAGLLYLFVYSCPDWLKTWIPSTNRGGSLPAGSSEPGILSAKTSTMHNHVSPGLCPSGE